MVYSHHRWLERSGLRDPMGSGLRQAFLLRPANAGTMAEKTARQALCD